VAFNLQLTKHGGCIGNQPGTLSAAQSRMGLAAQALIEAIDYFVDVHGLR